ncbi:MAG: DUF2079 domain-containing protein, partial [Thermoplasmata archaeon]
LYIQKFLSNNKRSDSISDVMPLKFLIVSLVAIGVYLIVAEHIKGMIYGQSIDLTSLSSLLYYLHEKYNIVFSLNMMLSYPGLKGFIIFLMLIGGGVFAFRYPVLLLPVIPYILFAFFSANTAYFLAGYQYTAMLSPVIIAGSVVGLSKVLNRKNSEKVDRHRLKKGLTVSIIVVMISLNFVLSPISPMPLHINSDNIASISAFKYNETSKLVFTLSSYINQSSYMLLQNNLYPQFFRSGNAYLLYSYNLIGNLGDLLRENFTYIIGDKFNNFYTQTSAVGISMQSLIHYELMNGYGIFLDQYGIIVIKYGYNGPIHTFDGNRIID